MYRSVALASLSLFAAVRAQQVGTNTAEVHPKLTVQKCTKAGGCVNSAQSIVLDANWRWLHTTTGYTNCYSGQSFDAAICPDAITCAKNCAVDGADYPGTYGISTSGNALSLKFITKSSGTNVGSRVYLLDPNDTTYTIFKLKNKEFTFDVDVSGLPCGLNGALYFSEMVANGGLGGNNAAGSKYGTGYCDAQCPRDLKFINGEANSVGWTGSDSDANSGKGKFGSCCTEMDIWEANSQATAYTPHPCDGEGLVKCDGNTNCADVCDQPGCDFNSWRQGNKTFYGRGAGFTLDTTKKMTVVTQFITADGTDTGALVDIRRKYVQNGRVIENSQSLIPGVTGNSVTESYCAAQKSAFDDTNVFQAKGGYKKLGDSFAKGAVLVMSIWDDHVANMLWLDSDYPLEQDPAKPGINRGPCPRDSGKPADVETNAANAAVTFSNIKFGELDTTYTGTPASGGNPPVVVNPPASSSTRPATSSAVPVTSSARPVTSSAVPVTSSARPVTSSARPVTTSSTPAPVTTSARPATSAPAPGGCTVQKYGQCGGTGYTGCKTCATGSTCKVGNPYYSQCL